MHPQSNDPDTIVTRKDAPLFILFSDPPPGAKVPAVVCAAVNTVRLCDPTHADWGVSFKGLEDRMWMPGPIDHEGVLVPSRKPGGKAHRYKRVGMSARFIGVLYDVDALIHLPGFWSTIDPRVTA